MKRTLTFSLPPILEQFSDEQLISAVPKIILRKIYWDDIQEGDSVTFEVKLSETLVLLFVLLTGSFNSLYYNKEFLDERSIVPASLVMGFISAVGGCYLGGENIFLVKKREAIFYSPLTVDTDTLFIRGEVTKKYAKLVKEKERYYADLDQKVYIKEGVNLIKVAETGALAGILKKTRPIEQQKSELIPVIYFDLPETLTQLREEDLRKDLGYQFKPRSFNELEIDDGVELSIQITHKMVLLFALLSGDYNPLHTDPDFAQALTAFEGKNIAHGALLSAWFSGNALLDLVGTRFRLVKRDEATYLRAVKVGDYIRIILRIRNKYRKGLTDYYVEVEEKLFIKKDGGREIEAVNSGSKYELIY